MRLALVLSLTALFAGYLALLVLRQKLRDRATQKRFMALQLHHLVPTIPAIAAIAAKSVKAAQEFEETMKRTQELVSGPAHSQERYDSLARLIRERTGK